MENKTIKIYDIDGHKTNHRDEGENTSSIVSELIALAARYCDYYASDIVYDINAFMNAVENKEAYNKYLCFYDSGVHSVSKYNLLNTENGIYTKFENARACYNLAYDAERQIQRLTRIEVHVSRGF